MIELVPLGADGFRAFVEEAVPAYAADKVASGEWSAEQSLELARASLANHLPQGLATPDHFFFAMRDTETAENVGLIWIGAQVRAGKRIAYVYDVSVKPPFRRKGYATHAFLALEEKVRTLGMSGIGLHVFAHNSGAQALYRKLGYQLTDINMFKAIG